MLPIQQTNLNIYYVFAIGFSFQTKYSSKPKHEFIVETFEQKNVLCFDKQLSVDCKRMKKI